MEAYLDQGELPTDAEVRSFLENLALDTLLDEAGEPNRALLRAATLFTLPVPEPVMDALAVQVGGSSPRLRGMGLLDPYEDLHDPAHTALAVTPSSPAVSAHSPQRASRSGHRQPCPPADRLGRPRRTGQKNTGTSTSS